MRAYDVSITALIVVFTLAVMVTDLRTRKIPNWLTVPSFFLALAFHGLSSGLDGLIFALLGFATGFGVLFALWMMGGGGGGDVKMMAALGAWLGVNLTLQVFLVSALVTLAMSGARMVHAIFAGRTRAVRRSLQAGTQTQGGDAGARNRRVRKREALPYAVPVAVGTWIVLAVAWTAGTLP